MSIINDQLTKLRQEKHQEYLRKLEQEENHEKEQQEKNRLEYIEIKKHQEKLFNDDLKNCEQETHEVMINSQVQNEESIKTGCNISLDHQEHLDYSYIVIISTFDEDDNIREFVKNNILYNFYEKIQNISISDLYIFYISIKEICSTYGEINIELVVNTLKIIDMNDYFIDVLNKLNKIDNIKIIFQEFINLINYFKPELSL